MSESPLSAAGDGVAIAVWVVPGSSRSVIDGRHGDRLKIRVTSPPEGGKADAEVARLLSDVLDAEVKLRAGIRGRSKVFEVSKTNIDEVRQQLGLKKLGLGSPSLVGFPAFCEVKKWPENSPRPPSTASGSGSRKKKNVWKTRSQITNVFWKRRV